MNRLTILFVFGLFCAIGYSQESMPTDSLFHASMFKLIEFRSLGPAFASGRIADIAIHPEDENVWYVAAGSGGVWKTENAGTTWTPIFDKETSYSIGCLAIDPANPHVIWVGTGENVAGRHVGFGDGIYRSDNGGKSWKNMGLKESQHISEIVIHPENSNIIWVAAQGPLWNKGGERGLYKSTDGGKTWKKTLGNEEWTGVTDIAIDPRNPDRLYAATWDRHRTVAAYMGGGPGTGLHRSTDGGETWEELKKGLPQSNMGKIGLAMSPQQPDVLYAAIELDRRTGGVFRSEDRGSSWKKMSDAVAGGTGPHYYQELYASPHAFDRIYLADVRIQVSDDGGKNFRRLEETYKHSDNHAMVFKADDPDYLMIGTDGGIYESFDLAENWRFIDNLPLTQYYKVAVDDAEPFYNVYGGTQDVNTHGGPSRTDNVHGIRNGDWYITLFGDGHQPATEPGNPDIIYSEWQQGNLCRIDKTTGEIVYIKPQPAAGEPHERYNWDAPILVSPHNPTRLYFASQRVWRSDDRGDNWEAISTDLTRNENRIELPIMGRKQSYDNPWDVYAMSNYNTITSLSESPVEEGLIYAGTDDGILQVTENGGESWRKIELGTLPDLPETAFVNDVKADLFDANTVYLICDNHKYGDFTPYIYRSTDRGKTWKSIRNNLPDRTLLWRIVQDHEAAGLMFLATEFGIYFTIDGGDSWTQLKGGLPTISIRDLAIQRRENDLIAASFGRGFYILDDYSFLREISKDLAKKEAALLPIRDALWYIPRPGVGFGGKGNQGAGYYVAENPPFGAVFTYYIAEDINTAASKRKKSEKEANKNLEDIPFVGYDSLSIQLNEEKPKIWLVVRNQEGEVIRRLLGKTSKGFHRLAWDLRMPDHGVIDLGEPFDADQNELLVAPGNYSVQMYKEHNYRLSELTEPRSFHVKRMREGALKGADPAVTAAFWRELEDVRQELSAIKSSINIKVKKVTSIRTAVYRSNSEIGDIDERLSAIRNQLVELKTKLEGDPAKKEIGEKTNPTIQERINFANTGTSRSTYGPTPSHRKSLEIARDEMANILDSLREISDSIEAVEQDLSQLNAPVLEYMD